MTATDEKGALALPALISIMNRFLTRLGNTPGFKQTKLGVAGWSVLSFIAVNERASNKDLARALGVTGQRAAQIINQLRQSGLIAVAQSSEDSRKNVLALTEAGTASLETVNQYVDHLWEQGDARGRSLTILMRHLRLLTRLMAAPVAGQKD